MKKIIINSAVFLFLFVLFGCNESKKQKSNSENETIPNQTITVGYIAYPPGFIINPNNNEMSGVFYDVLNKVAEIEGWKLKYSPVSWGSMIQDLNKNKVDIIGSPVWATPGREANAQFSAPLFYSPIGIFVRKDDNRFNDDFNLINNPSVKISAIQGEFNSEIWQNDFKKASCVPKTDDASTDDIINDVINGKADVTFTELMYANQFLDKNPNTNLKNIVVGSPIRFLKNSYMLKKGNVDLENKLNMRITQLVKDGTVDSILNNYKNQYFPKPGLIFYPSDSTAIKKAL